MNPWKRLLLATYLYGTLPYRRWANARAGRCGRAPVMVLFYHRVADAQPNDWTLSSRLFERQVRWLQARFELVSLAEAQRRIGGGGNERPAVCITFDDGYADNCQFALPLLLKERIPFTYFVSTQYVMEGLPFPHDVALGQPLRPNNLKELKALAAAGVEIGAHTRTHADLGQVQDARQLHDEVVTAGRDLQRALDCPIRYLAFPYGQSANLNGNAFRLAREAGYAGVCSAYGGYNFPGDDPFHLQRVHADPEPLRFQNWLTGDPRQRRVKRCEPTTLPEEERAVGRIYPPSNEATPMYPSHEVDWLYHPSNELGWFYHPSNEAVSRDSPSLYCR